MNFFKRALISTIRRPGKTLLLFLLLFTLSNVLASVIAISQGLHSTRTIISKTLGAEYAHKVQRLVRLKPLLIKVYRPLMPSMPLGN